MFFILAFLAISFEIYLFILHSIVALCPQLRNSNIGGQKLVYRRPMVKRGAPHFLLPYAMLALGGAVGNDACEMVQDYNKK